MNSVDIDVCSIPKRKVFTLRAGNHYLVGIGHLKKCNKSNKTRLKKCVLLLESRFEKCKIIICSKEK